MYDLQATRSVELPANLEMMNKIVVKGKWVTYFMLIFPSLVFLDRGLQ